VDRSHQGGRTAGVGTAAAESGHPSAKVYPLAGTRSGFVQNSRQVTVYDPDTKKFTFIDTCFGTHHLNFAEDANNTLWLSNNTQNELAVVGWVNTKLFWETGNAAQAQGWTPLIVDTNGNGKRDAYVEPNQPDDPTKDKRIGLGFYGIAYSPADGSIWGSNIGFPGYVLRLNLGPNPSETALVEVYKVPEPGFGMRGFDVDRQGVAYGKIVELRVPYPMGFFAKGVDGRIDDPNAGWKGKGLWVTSGNRTPAPIEGIDAPSPGAPGKTLSSPLVVHFQLRPDPLAH
jgi:hypothetical protein